MPSIEASQLILMVSQKGGSKQRPHETDFPIRLGKKTWYQWDWITQKKKESRFGNMIRDNRRASQNNAVPSAPNGPANRSNFLEHRARIRVITKGLPNWKKPATHGEAEAKVISILRVPRLHNFPFLSPLLLRQVYLK